MLTPHQRRDLLRIEQSRDADAIAFAIRRMLYDNPTADLLEIEMTLRAAASTAFVIANDSGFRVVIGIKPGSPNSIGSAGRRNRTEPHWPARSNSDPT